MKNPEEIIAWFNSERDYYKGLDILSRYSSKRKLLAKLQQKGHTKQFYEKVTYELWKFTTLPETVRFKKVMATINKKVAKVPSAAPTKAPRKKVVKKIDKTGIPQVVKDIIAELKVLYNKRALAHKKLQDMPDDNMPTRIRQREEIVKAIQPLSARIENLFNLKEDYFLKGIIPKMPQDDNSDKKGKNYDDLSVTQKVKKLNSFRVMLSQSKNKLQNMHDGPKKIKLQERMDYYQEQITILSKLVE